MNGKPAQASMEYIMIAGLVALVIIPTTFIFYRYASDSAEEIDRAQIDKLGRDIVSTAETVYYLGEPSRIVISERLPKNVRNISVEQDPATGTYLFEISVSHGGTISVFSFPTKVNIFSAFSSEDFNAGVKNVRIEAKKDRTGTPFSAVTFDRPLLRAFVTSVAYSGAIGGIKEADATCSQLATSASLGDGWQAWLSNSTVNAKDRIPNGVYVRVDNKLVAANIDNLTSGALISPISLDEGGTDVGALALAWTGTKADGTAGSGNCGNWLAFGSGTIGVPAETNSQWTDDSSFSCSDSARFYCFEK